MNPIRVGLIGLGNVGTGVARLLTEHADRIARRAGRPVVVTRVAVRNSSRPRHVTMDARLVTTDPLAVAGAEDVDVVVELMGGLCPARKVVHTALEAGKDVVTANKALLCEHGPELFAAARQRGRCLAFEASVAGGIPIIGVLGQSMTANQITAIEAIINGTSNFILTEMFRTRASYEDTVTEAQRLGYAEADPAMDVNGTDAAQKLTILAQLAFGTRVLPGEFPVQGIDRIEQTDLVYADELGYAIKLLATARLTKGELEMHVQPTFIRHGRPLAQVNGAHNMIARPATPSARRGTRAPAPARCRPLHPSWRTSSMWPPAAPQSHSRASTCGASSRRTGGNRPPPSIGGITCDSMSTTDRT
ncbi:MAG: homoserine dehydrogenase [Planctomycetaceae bacterium]